MLNISKIKRAVACACAVACIGILASCSVVEFETVEEMEQKEATMSAVARSSVEVDPEQMLDQPLVYENVLKTSAGGVLAKYYAQVPQFEENGEKSSVFASINQYYQTELETYEQDCESFFSQIREQFGAAWDSVMGVGYAETQLTYELVPSSGDFICLQRDIKITDREGNSTEYTGADVFSASTGWQVKLSDLFGDNMERHLR